MAQQNTGYARMKTLTVIKGDYTHSYSITGGFTDLNGNPVMSLTDTQFAQLSEEAYNMLLDQFIEYVKGQEPGLANDCPDLRNGAMVFDTVSCPLTFQANEEE